MEEDELVVLNQELVCLCEKHYNQLGTTFFVSL
jgi:hypothetical protein